MYLHKFLSMKEHIAYSKKVYTHVRNNGSDFMDTWEGDTCLANLKTGKKIGRNFKHGWDGVFRLAALPWKEGMEHLANARKELKGIELPVPESIRRRKSWSMETGDGVDIHRLYQGIPYWRSVEGRQAQGGCPIVTVLANVGTEYGFGPEQIVWRGIAALIVTDILEDAGYRVELWSCRQGNCQYLEDPTGDNRLMTATLLKESHGPIVEPLVVSGLAGWYYRTIVWMSYYDLPTDQRPSYSLGEPQDHFAEEAKELVTGEGYTGKVFEIANIYDLDACVELVRKTIAEFNPSEESAVGVG